MSTSLTSACASCDATRGHDTAPDVEARGGTVETTGMGSGVAPAPPPSAPPLQALGRGQICVTCGGVTTLPSGQLTVDQPKVRAVVAAPTPPVAELRFVYRGPTAETLALGSGAIRRQLGLKLRAQDGCNVLYVMWRIDPTPALVVSVKHNPGQSRSSECGNRGYRNLPPLHAGRLPLLEEDVAHVLHAEAHGDSLEVTVDGAPVWAGTLPPEALSFDGPVGFRTDNVRVDFELWAVPLPGAPPAARCSGLDSGE